MPTDVVVPQIEESTFECTITKWLKKVGDTVHRDEPLFEIFAGSMHAKIASPVAGMVAEIKIPEGMTIQISTTAAVIVGTTCNSSASAPLALEQLATRAAKIIDSKISEQTTLSTRSSFTAPEIGFDADLIPDTGSRGRLIEESVSQDQKQQVTCSATNVTTSPKYSITPTSVPSTLSTRTGDIPCKLVPLTKMRKIIAQRMVESKQISPHVHSVFSVDMTQVVRLREGAKQKFELLNGVKLTYMPFIAIAAIEALRKFPIINASLENAIICHHENINLGIAVALEWGLIVPVVKQAEERGFLGLARAIVDLADRARTRRLKPDEASGSTFTLTNSGIFGEDFCTPIINQPESAILAIGGLKKEPVVKTDTQGNDFIAIRSVQHFCLGFDHRIIDGADAGRFMSDFKRTLENWSREIG